MTKDSGVRRVIAEYVETWSGAHGHPGFCVCRVIEEEGKPVRVERGKAMYLRHMPEMRDWVDIFDRADSNLRARAWYEQHGKRKKRA
jgi:hypothetical protein